MFQMYKNACNFLKDPADQPEQIPWTNFLITDHTFLNTVSSTLSINVNSLTYENDLTICMGTLKIGVAPKNVFKSFVDCLGPPGP